MLQRYNIFPIHHHPSLLFYIGMEIPYIPSQHTKFALSNKKFSILNYQFSTVNSLTPKKNLNYQLSILNYQLSIIIMIITVQKMKEVFAYCNKMYFGGKMARPKLSTGRSTYYVARTYCIPNYKTRRCGGIQIRFSEMFDFTEEDLINVMCHEMIHLNLYRRFIEKYGLNIIQTYTDSPKQVGKLTFGEEIWQFIYNTFIFKEI